MEKIFKGMVTVALLMVMGVFSVIEICIEVTYQFWRLVKSGYRYMMDELLKLVRPIYERKVVVVKPVHKEEPEIKYEIFEID